MRKYLSDFVDDKVAIKSTNQIEDAVRQLVEACTPERTVDLNISLDISIDGERHLDLWRFVAGRLK